MQYELHMNGTWTILTFCYILLSIISRLKCDHSFENIFVIFFGTPVFLHTQIVNQTALVVS